MSTPEIKAFILAIEQQEQRAVDELKVALLATLGEYRAPTNIKKIFEDAIKSVTVL